MLRSRTEAEEQGVRTLQDRWKKRQRHDHSRVLGASQEKGARAGPALPASVQDLQLWGLQTYFWLEIPVS